MVILYLTCASNDEAKKIALALLDAKLAACIRRLPVESDYWWDDNIQHDSEVLLMIESKEEKFDEINALVEKLHSYKDYVLTAVPVVRTTPGVLTWINDVTK